MWTFINLFIIIGILAAIIGIKMLLPFWNWVLALLSTVFIVVGSAFLLTSSNYEITGAYLMMTLPGAPVAFVVIWVLFVVADLIGKWKTPAAPKPQPHFGRESAE